MSINSIKMGVKGMRLDGISMGVTSQRREEKRSQDRVLGCCDLKGLADQRVH